MSRNTGSSPIPLLFPSVYIHCILELFGPRGVVNFHSIQVKVGWIDAAAYNTIELWRRWERAIVILWTYLGLEQQYSFDTSEIAIFKKEKFVIPLVQGRTSTNEVGPTFIFYVSMF